MQISGVGTDVIVSSSDLSTAPLLNHALLPLSQPADSYTLIDPSHIIHLIRQLLPEHYRVKRGSCIDNEVVTSNGFMENVSDSHHLIPNGKVEQLELTHNSCEISGTCKEVHIQEESLDEQENGQGNMRKENCPESVGQNDRYQKVTEEESYEYTEFPKQAKPGATESLQEEAGCVLWDLAANPAHAEFMVEHHILEVLHNMLNACVTDRMREICLGIMGNLACHTVTTKAMISVCSLVETIVEQLFLDDSPSLCETCRLLSAGLHSSEVISWTKALQPLPVLERIMWIAANTMNAQLLEKSTELLLAMVDSHNEAAATLLPSLMNLGLPELLMDLLMNELSSIDEGVSANGDTVLDTVLQIGEAISLADEYSAKLASDEKLFNLACKVIRLCRKDESYPQITAAVLVANLLAEKGKLIDEIVNDAIFLENILQILPDVYDDPGARNALWSVLGRIFDQISVPDEMKGVERKFVLVLAGMSSLIAEALVEHQNEDTGGSSHSSEIMLKDCLNKGLKAKMETVRKMVNILDHFSNLDDGDPVAGLNESVKAASRNLKSIVDHASVDSI